MKPLLELEQCFQSSDSLPPDTVVEQLEKVNKLDTQDKDCTDQQIIDLIVLGTTKIPIQHKASSAFCHFIFKQCTKQIRVSSFRASSFEKCLLYLLNGMEKDQASAELLVDILRALSALIYENSTNTSKFYTRLTPCLLKFADRSMKPLEIRRMAVNCLGNLCAGAGSKLQLYYKDIYQVLLSNLCVVGKGSMASVSSLDLGDSAVRKVASSTLRALQFLLSQDRTLVSNPLYDSVDIVHTFLFMHVDVQSYQQLSALLSSGKDSSNKIMTRPQGMNRCSRTTQSYHQQPSWRSLNSKYLSTGIISSDSEMSDSDGMTFNPRRCRDDAKIRNNALLCLLAIAKTQPKTLYPHWQKFIPDTFSIFLKNHVLASSLPTTASLGSATTYHPISPILRSDHQPYSLLTLLLYDPMVTVRVATCHTLIAMLEGSKQYLTMASERETTSSFTSLSEKLGFLVHDLHLGLVYALAKETDPDVMVLILKVMSTLMVNTSYDRLSSGYLTQFYRAILSHCWNSEGDPGQAVAVLQTLAAMMTATGATLEIQAILTGGGDDTVRPLLLPFLLSLVDVQGGGLPEIQVETWHILSVCAKHHFKDVIFHVWDRIEAPFELAFSQPRLRSVSLGFVEAFASSMTQYCSVDVASEDLETCIKWWMMILEKYIQQASMDSLSDVRVLTCDCLSSMAKPVFEQLPARYQRLAMALLLPLPEDEEAQVRAAACRALGAFVLFPSLREDTCFVSDMATAILDRMEDPVTLVRLRASWAQGNLCDALVIASDVNDFCLREWISISTWSKILGTSTVASLDNDKLRSNAVRAMGSLLRITPPDYFQDRHVMFLLRDAMAGLVKNIESGSLKTRWNACHAASNAMNNPAFPLGFMQQRQFQQSDYDDEGELYAQRQHEYPWTATLFRALIHALTQCKNYKVRINAALALATPHQAAQYGHHLATVFNTVLSSWHDCHDPNATAEFQEYKYQEQMKDQIKSALLHLRPWLPELDQVTIDTLFLNA